MSLFNRKKDEEKPNSSPLSEMKRYKTVTVVDHERLMVFAKNVYDIQKKYNNRLNLYKDFLKELKAFFDTASITKCEELIVKLQADTDNYFKELQHCFRNQLVEVKDNEKESENSSEE